MSQKKKIFAISGSTRNNSSNFKILKLISELTKEKFEMKIFEGLSEIPHFNTDLDTENPPKIVSAFRNEIAEADGILICTPEYIFSLPGSLKNALEWCVSTTIFSQKKVGLITASASGEKAQEELALIMKTVEAKFSNETELLIQGVRGKVNNDGIITDIETLNKITHFINSFDKLLNL
ncbi:MAG: NAD(P)H-dependent oxidoreductase [Flavobacterium sp.]|uniref:NADPH-dependent FMN reductase n=1 Tax=Flavobacterium sp. TaxID=239 RepID=UPI00261958E3|nr:NADPH-dependent FMN reductase [Flavobacterium sp.]MDD5149061.1 NAD(P)H-dependent oxidoreductase [Flavobacterium sp.]